MTDDMQGPASHTSFSQRLRLHYVDWGNPDQPPLLMLNGERDHCQNWDWTAAALRDEWHIMTPDLRRHGHSQWSPDGSFTLARYIYDLAQQSIAVASEYLLSWRPAAMRADGSGAAARRWQSRRAEGRREGESSCGALRRVSVRPCLAEPGKDVHFVQPTTPRGHPRE